MGNELNPPTDAEQSHGDQGSTPPTHGVNTAPHGEQRDQNQQPNNNPALEELQRKLSELERDNKKYRAERRQQEEAAAAAELAHKKEQGQFKELAEQHENRVKELEPKAERLEKLAVLMNAQIKAEIKDWPATVKVFDPGEDADIVARMDWFEKSKPIIEQLQLQARGQQPGNGPNPRPMASTPDDARNEFAKKLRATGKYGA